MILHDRLCYSPFFDVKPTFVKGEGFVFTLLLFYGNSFL